ncbi:helix-turn-helix domain-containing protein [Patescibacteria group bacterium]|nr:helix-turn-helix domain-containing protein [Patescibacteria group bacterium]
MTQRLLTPEQVADSLQVHHLTVLKFIKNKKLKSIKLGRIYRIREEDLADFLEKLETI